MAHPWSRNFVLNSVSALTREQWAAVARRAIEKWGRESVYTAPAFGQSSGEEGDGSATPKVPTTQPAQPAPVYHYQYQYNTSGSIPYQPPLPNMGNPNPAGAGVGTGTGTGGNQRVESPTLPEHIYVRQEGSPQTARVYDASTGKPITNVTDVEVVLDKTKSKLRVKAIDGEKEYPIQDLTIDANNGGNSGGNNGGAE